MKIPLPVLRLLNPIVVGLLRSPLHGLMSADVMLITVGLDAAQRPLEADLRRAAERVVSITIAL
jgi:hypothetical protein